MSFRSVLTSVRGMHPALRLLLTVGVLAGGIGASQSALQLGSTFQQASAPEFERRQESWSRAYGFGTYCEPKLIPDGRLVLVNPIVGQSEAWRTDTLEIDPDASHFAYPLTPRVVSVVWDLSTPWVPQPGEADYIALWDQVAFRTETARAATETERHLITSASPTAIVCSYEDAQGDHGTIYAVSARALNAPQAAASAGTAAGLSQPYDSLGGLLRGYLAIASLWAIGLLLMLIGGRGLPLALKMALALPLGCAAAALELAVFSIARIPWTGWAIATPYLALTLFFLALRRAWLWRPARVVRAILDATMRVQVSAVDLGLVVVLLVLAGVLVAIVPFGIPAGDGFTTTYFKANVFWTNGSVLPFYENAPALMYSIPGHPPGLPLIVDWFYLVAGRIDEHTSLLLWPALFCSFLGLMFALARSAASTRVALIATLVIGLSASDMVRGALQPGYADMPLGVFLVSGVGVIWLYAIRPRSSWHGLVLAGLLLGGAAWVKEEGIVAGPAAILATAIYAFGARSRTAQRSWVAPMAVGAGYVLVLAPLLLLRFSHPVSEAILHNAGLSTAVSRVPSIIIGFAPRMVQHWFLSLGVLLVVAWQFRTRSDVVRILREPGFWVPVAVLVLQLGADCAGVALNPIEVNKEMTLVGGRLLLQLTPVALLTMFMPLALIAGNLSWSPAHREGVASMTEQPERRSPVALNSQPRLT